MIFGVIVLAAGLAAGTSAEGVCTNGLDVLRLEASAAKLPQCLSRFLDYPPGRGKLGFPRCLFENPFPPNPDFWLKDVDFSCASPWNDSFGALRAGTAISRRHVIFAKHFPVGNGTRMAFVGVHGDASHYRITAMKALDGCDIMIGLLDYELTPDVHPAKVLPQGFEKWLTDQSKWPVVTFNQREQAYLSEVTCSWDQSQKQMRLSNGRPMDARWQQYGGSIISGDSGDPAFLLCKDSPILLYCVYSAGIGHGPMIHEYRSKVQKAMDDLCPGYKLEEFDFASP